MLCCKFHWNWKRLSFNKKGIKRTENFYRKFHSTRDGDEPLSYLRKHLQPYSNIILTHKRTVYVPSQQCRWGVRCPVFLCYCVLQYQIFALFGFLCSFLSNMHHCYRTVLCAGCSFVIRNFTVSHINDAISYGKCSILEWHSLFLTRHINHQWNVYIRERRINGFQLTFAVCFIRGISAW